MNQEDKDYIDSLSYEELLTHWRFALVGNRWFQGDLGAYWQHRMESRKNSVAVAVSKKISWEDYQRESLPL